MAYDEELAERIHELLAAETDLTCKRMFGGLAFLIGGHMAVTASRLGGLMVRVDPGGADALLRDPSVRTVEMRGRTMPGWLRVDARLVATDDELRRWVLLGVARVRSLPAQAG